MMRAAVLAICVAACTPPATVPRTSPTTLAGAWIVDLTPEPGAPRYEKPMNLTLAADGSVTGDFYESAIQAGRWKTQAGRTCTSFRTTDGAGPYHTSACLDGDEVVGQTWAEHRAFVFLWRGSRAHTN
jgi:hypothetical protein